MESFGCLAFCIVVESGCYNTQCFNLGLFLSSWSSSKTSVSPDEGFQPAVYHLLCVLLFTSTSTFIKLVKSVTDIAPTIKRNNHKIHTMLG